MVKDETRSPCGGSGIDVLFATYNGAKTLPAMLAALEGLAPPRRAVRVVVVDNASTDETPGLLAQAEAKLPITRLCEARPGKVAALLTGAAALRGDLVVFTDDDVLPDPDWLRGYEDAADAHPECGVFGGPIAPAPIEPLDPWFDAIGAFGDVLFARTAAEEGIVTPEHSLFGPNFMLRRDLVAPALEAMAAFGPDRSQNFAMGEDTAALARLSALGHRAWFAARARVGHQVRRSYTTLEYMLKRAQRVGRRDAVVRLLNAPDRAGVALAAAEAGLRCASQSLRAAAARLARGAAPDPLRFDALYKANYNRGLMLGLIGR